MSALHKPTAGDPEMANIVRFKARLIRGMREFLYARDAIEVPMPILQRTREGAPIDQWTAVRPETGDRWFLRHSMEDHLRRVSVAHPRVFEIGKAIRADGGSPMHAHEFVLLELVFRGLAYDDGVALIQDLVAGAVADAADADYGRGDLFRGIQVRRWEDIFEEATGLPVGQDGFIASCKLWLASRGIVPLRPYTTDWEVLEDIMKHVVEPACISPTIITYFPKELQHVCSTSTATGRALRMSAVVNGVEVSDGGLKFERSDEYRRIYQANASYRSEVLGLDGNTLPEEFFADLDAMGDSAFTAGMGVDRITALTAGCHVERALIFPEG